MEIIKGHGDDILILGETASYGQGGKDIWLIKIDSFGNKIWDKPMVDRRWNSPLLSTDQVLKVIKLEAHFIHKRVKRWTYYKSNPNGEVLWMNTYGGKNLDGLTSGFKKRWKFFIGYTNSISASGMRKKSSILTWLRKFYRG